jgi:hypothetical protein
MNPAVANAVSRSIASCLDTDGAEMGPAVAKVWTMAPMAKWKRQRISVGSSSGKARWKASVKRSKLGPN